MARVRRRHLRKSSPEATALNITAFLNLMVILVPFLLMTAVFTHLSILELNLPTSESSNKSNKKKPTFNLKIVVRDKTILVVNGNKILRKISPRDGQPDFRLLSKTIQQVKAGYPKKTAATILSQQTTPYDTLIKIMDAVRSFHTTQEGSIIEAELFPDLSIGDAPG